MKWWTIAVLVSLALGGIGYWWWENVAFCNVEEARAAYDREMALAHDTCLYALSVPPDIDMPETPAFDTTIVRAAGCEHHMLHFPAWGTGTDYKITGNGLERSVGFGIDEKEKQWLEISDLPVGDYSVHLLACGNGGFFKLRIQ